MKKIKENKGITLVALIITIIVLLILAAVAISAVQGDGIIAHAKNARDSYQTAQETENTALAGYLTQIENANKNNGDASKKEEYTLTNNVNQEEINELASYLINNDLADYDEHDKCYMFIILNYVNEEEEEAKSFYIEFNSQNQIDHCCYGFDGEEIIMYMSENEYNISKYKWTKEVYEDEDCKQYHFEEVTNFPKIKIADIETYMNDSIDENNWEGSTEDFMKAVQKVLDTFGE